MRTVVLMALAAQVLSAGRAVFPTRFEENRGQFPASVRFYGRGVDPSITLETQAQRIGKMTARFQGASSSVTLTGVDPMDARTNYFGPSRVTGVRNFARVRYQAVYPGIDAVFYSNGRELEYDFVIAPHASPDSISIRLDGADRVRLSADGDLVASDASETLQFHRPVIYQDINGKRVPVAGGYRLHGREVRFEVGTYREDLPLVIDPVVSYATYLGKSDAEVARGVAVDPSGNAYVAGYTKSADLPVTNPAVQPGYGGRTSSVLTGDAFVAKFSPTGSLLYLTYLGGSGDDVATGIAVDAAGNAYVTGFTNSGNFPTTAGAFQTKYGGQGGNERLRLGDAFVSKISPNGGQLIYSTYVGGSRDELGMAIAIDNSGNAYVTGSTLSTDFPGTVNGAQKAFAGTGGQAISGDFPYPFYVGGDAFLCKLNPAGSQLVYATYFGGKADEIPFAVAVDSAGNAYIGGATLSTDLPVTANALQRTYKDKELQNSFFNFGDGYVAKVNPAGSAFLYVTYLGGKGDDIVTAIAADDAGNAYVTGPTTSADFPTTAGALQRTYGGPDIDIQKERIIGDMFVSKLNPAGTALVFSTYFGRSGDESATAIAVDAAGDVFVGGQSSSPQLPTTSDAIQKSFSGYGGIFSNGDDFGDGFVFELNPTGTSVLYASYLGGGADDTVQGIALDRSGNLFVAGATVSSNFPVSAGAYQTVNGGAAPAGKLKPDAFLVKLSGFAAPNQPVLNAITNAASNVAGVVSPGMVFVAYGSNLGPGAIQTATFDGGKVTTLNSDVRILFDGVPAPIVYVLDRQVSGIVPYAVVGKTTTQISVEYKGIRSGSISAQVADAAPGLFSANFSGTGQGSIYNQDNSVNSASNPAAKGSIIVLYGTGEGQTVPAGVDGLVANTVYPKPALPVTVTVAGQGASIAYAGAVPGVTAGVFQVNAVIPNSVPSGNQPVVVSFGSFKSQTGLTVAVQ